MAVAHVDGRKAALIACAQRANERRVVGALALGRLVQTLHVELRHKSEQRVVLEQKPVDHLGQLLGVALQLARVLLRVLFGGVVLGVDALDPCQRCLEEVARDLCLERRPERLVISAGGDPTPYTSAGA